MMRSQKMFHWCTIKKFPNQDCFKNISININIGIPNERTFNEQQFFDDKILSFESYRTLRQEKPRPAGRPLNLQGCRRGCFARRRRAAALTTPATTQSTGSDFSRRRCRRSTTTPGHLDWRHWLNSMKMTRLLRTRIWTGDKLALIQ